MNFNTVLFYRERHPVHEAKRNDITSTKCGANVFIRDGWRIIDPNYAAQNPVYEYDRIASLPRCKRCRRAE